MSRILKRKTSNPRISSVIIPQVIRVYSTKFKRLLGVGQVVALSSAAISLNTFNIFSFTYLWQAHSDSNRELRFWRPLFYQLKLWALSISLIGLGLFMLCMLFTKLTELILNDLILYVLGLIDHVILIFTLFAHHCNYISFKFRHDWDW